MNTEDPSSLLFVYTAASIIGSGLDYRNYYPGMEPVVGPAGVQYASFRPSTAGVTFVITANCENPEAAFRMGDLMVTENMSIIQRWGAEGKDWDYIDNVPGKENYVSRIEGWPAYLVAYDDGTYWSSGNVQNAGWRQTGPYIRQYGIANGSARDPKTVTPYAVNNANCDDLYQKGGWNPAEVIPKLLYTEEEMETISEAKAALKSYVNERTAAFLVGSVDIDAEWDAFVEECYNIGLEEVLEVENAVYTRMYK